MASSGCDEEGHIEVADVDKGISRYKHALLAKAGPFPPETIFRMPGKSREDSSMENEGDRGRTIERK